MAERFYRAQILLEPEQHKALVEIASREGRSISDVVREMITLQLEQREQQVRSKRREVLERIRQHRAQILEQRGGQPLDVDVVALINKMREERDERNLGHAPDRRD